MKYLAHGCEITQGIGVLVAVPTYVLEFEVSVHIPKHVQDFELSTDLHPDFCHLRLRNPFEFHIGLHIVVQFEQTIDVLASIRHHHFSVVLRNLGRKDVGEIAIVFEAKGFDFLENF